MKPMPRAQDSFDRKADTIKVAVCFASVLLNPAASLPQVPE